MVENKREATEYDLEERQRESKFGVHYKWIALSNTTLGALMASIDGSILLIALPEIFNGLGVNPLVAGNVDLLLWLLLGYTIMSSVVVVTIGRLSDMFGRVKIYNLGFAVFAIASTLIYISSYFITGDAGILSITVLRLVQGLGGGFLFANSAAILTDAFPENERGKALGINSIAFIGGSLIGLLVGGFLATIDWHLIFMISVPIGVIGAVWAYIGLHEIAAIKKNQKFDPLGNITFAASITMILLAITYGLLPFGPSSMGWANPLVEAGIVVGFLLLLAFVFIELRTKAPLFNLALFKIEAFAAGNLSLFLAGMARGGLQFMLVIWLQGIWLPLHGVSFENTPLQAAILMSPLIIGFLVAGPVSGYLSDKYGAKPFTTAGMAINVVGFLLLATLPANFSYIPFAVIIFFLGIGQGMFTSPNTAWVMSASPPEYRGVSSGMRATLVNVAFMFSLVIFFSVLVAGISSTLPNALYSGLIAQNVSNSTAAQISNLPPTEALFAALLGYNPMKALIPASVIAALPKQNVATIVGINFFPTLISKPFIDGMQTVLYVGAFMSLVAAIASAWPTREVREKL
jgi:MFS family permease